MKNFLVTANFKLDQDKWYGNSNPLDYETMQTYCIDSFKKYLYGIDKVIVFNDISDKINNYHQIFKHIFYKIDYLYHSESCNILFIDLDTICIKPINIFNLYNNFRMFSIANQFKDTYPENVNKKLYHHLKPWFMSNVRYY